MTNDLLVSVCVITYNSSKTVVETLDSIYNQTYRHLELIISDDCSKDDTVKLCREWLDFHSDRFIRTELLTAKKNDGVSANMNRAERACRGEWVKPIAGDDILFDDCIESYLQYVSTHTDAIYVFAKMRPFGGDDGYRKQVESYIDSSKEFFQLSIEQQLQELTLRLNRICAPTSFYNRKKVEALGVTNDERIPCIDDLPKWINLLKKRVRFHFLEKPTVHYRVSESSLSNQTNPSKRIMESRDSFFIYYQFREYYREGRRKYALREYFRIKKERGGWFWRQVYCLSKMVL